MIREVGKKLSAIPVPVVLGVVTVLFAAGALAWHGPSANTAAKAPPARRVDSAAPPAASTPADAKSAPQSTPPTATVDVAQVKASLTDGTNYYVQLFQQGQGALGTTQYADAYAGIAALDDPSSAASVWSRFNTKFTGSDYSAAATKAYNQASDSYTAANVDTPSVVDDWNADINQAYSDIGQWVRDATSWQISSVSTAQLNSDAQKSQQDIAAARADISNL